MAIPISHRTETVQSDLEAFSKQRSTIKRYLLLGKCQFIPIYLRSFSYAFYKLQSFPFLTEELKRKTITLIWAIEAHLDQHESCPRIKIFALLGKIFTYLKKPVEACNYFAIAGNGYKKTANKLKSNLQFAGEKVEKDIQKKEEKAVKLFQKAAVSCESIGKWRRAISFRIKAVDGCFALRDTPRVEGISKEVDLYYAKRNQRLLAALFFEKIAAGYRGLLLFEQAAGNYEKAARLHASSLAANLESVYEDYKEAVEFYTAAASLYEAKDEYQKAACYWMKAAQIYSKKLPNQEKMALDCISRAVSLYALEETRNQVSFKKLFDLCK